MFRQVGRDGVQACTNHYGFQHVGTRFQPVGTLSRFQQVGTKFLALLIGDLDLRKNQNGRRRQRKKLKSKKKAKVKKQNKGKIRSKRKTKKQYYGKPTIKSPN